MMSLRKLLLGWLLLLPVSQLAGQEFSENNFDHYTRAD